MTRRRRIFLVILAVVAIVIAAIVVLARSFVPPWARTTIERLAGETLGRELRIAGAFRMAYSLEPAIVAEDVTLPNAVWGSEPAMIRAERIEIAIDLPSLASPPIRVRNVELRGVRVLLEKDAAGRGNWAFELKPRPEPAPAPAERKPVLVDRASLRDVELVYRSGPDATPFRFGIGRLEARLDAATTMVDLDASGHFNDAPWDVAGRLGDLDRLYELRDVSHDVTGHVGKARVALRGRIRDPLKLGDPQVEAELEGPDLAAALATLGVRSTVSGPFRARGRFAPSDGGVSIDVAGEMAEGKVEARGRVGTILEFDAVDVEVGVSGPDASAVGAWMKVDGLPGSPFELAGRLRRDGSRVTVDGGRGHVGATSLEIDGSIPDDLTFGANGSDLSEISGLARFPLPAVPFRVGGRFLRRGEVLALERVELRALDATAKGGGRIGTPPTLHDLDLSLEVAGSDLSRFSDLATVALPRASFELRGRVARAGDAFELHAVEGRLGDEALSVGGRIVPVGRLLGSELDARVFGPNLEAAGALFGAEGLASVPYAVEGKVRVESDGYRLHGVRAQAGPLAASVDGRVGARPREDGMELVGRAHGGALSDLAAWGVHATLPADPFEVSGGLRIAERVFHVDRAEAVVGEDRVTVDGTLGPVPDLSGLDLVVEAAGRNLADLGRFVPPSDGKPLRLPAEPYTVAARVRRVPAGIELREGIGTIGEASLRAEGTVGTGENFLGSDLRFDAGAPDAEIATFLTGVRFPPGAVRLRGRIERVDTGVRLEELAASIGDTRAEVSGFLGGRPGRAGTVLELHLSGPDLGAVLEPLTGVAPLPSEPFELSAQLEGGERRIASRRFEARLGENDLNGSVVVRLDGRPSLDADLRSGNLDLSKVFGGDPGAESAESAPAPAKGARVFSDEPLTLEFLNSLDARVRLTAARAVIPGLRLRDVTIEAEAIDGALRVPRAEGTGEHGGRAAATLLVEPVTDGYRVGSTVVVNGAKILVGQNPVPPEEAPSLDVKLELEGAGRSLHAIAASSRGGGVVTLGPGRIPNERSGALASGVVLGILDALNPFRKSSSHTEVECVVAVADVVGGKAAVQPVAARTEQLTVIGKGKVDLDSEAIEFGWTLKPRRGVGITAGSIANPYIKLGGTLSSPSLDAKPLEAAASTGAAVATGGLTVLFRGLYDRITAERKVCVRALEEAERQARKRESSRTPEAP